MYGHTSMGPYYTVTAAPAPLNLNHHHHHTHLEMLWEGLYNDLKQTSQYAPSIHI